MPQERPEISLAVGGETFRTLFDKLTIYFASLDSTFSGPSAPPNPAEGMLWFATTDRVLRVYSGGEWYDLLTALGTLPLNSILGRYFADDTIDADDKVRIGTITNQLIATNAITGDHIAPGSILESHIADGAITAAKVGRVGTANYGAETIEGQHVQTGALDGSVHLRDGSVPLSKLEGFETLGSLSYKDEGSPFGPRHSDATFRRVATSGAHSIYDMKPYFDYTNGGEYFLIARVRPGIQDVATRQSGAFLRGPDGTGFAEIGIGATLAAKFTAFPTFTGVAEQIDVATEVYDSDGIGVRGFQGTVSRTSTGNTGLQVRVPTTPSTTATGLFIVKRFK